MLSNEIFDHLNFLLGQQQARYRVVEHPAACRSEEVAKMRGTDVGQGVKALVCHVKGNGINQFILAALPADQQADFSRLALQIGGTQASLASPQEVFSLTQCVFCSIPPFSFHPDLLLVADPMLLTRFEELAFNAGTLEQSIILNTEDYQRIARPRLLAFRRTQHEITL